MRAQLLRYWFAMTESGVECGIHAVQVFFGMAGVHQVYDTIPALSVKQIAWVFFIAFARQTLIYLDTHKLPALPDPKPETTNAKP